MTIEEEVKEQPIKESTQFWGRIFSPKIIENDKSDLESKISKIQNESYKKQKTTYEEPDGESLNVSGFFMSFFFSSED